MIILILETFQGILIGRELESLFVHQKTVKCDKKRVLEPKQKPEQVNKMRVYSDGLWGTTSRGIWTNNLSFTCYK